MTLTPDYQKKTTMSSARMPVSSCARSKKNASSTTPIARSAPAKSKCHVSLTRGVTALDNSRIYSRSGHADPRPPHRAVQARLARGRHARAEGGDAGAGDGRVKRG